MSKYIAVHNIEPAANMDDVGPIAKKAKAGLSTDAYWVKSWLKLNDSGQVEAIFCEWDAKDAQSVRDALTNTIPELPFSEVKEMAEINSEDFR